MNSQKSTNNKLKDCVLERIESEQMCPRSRWFFLGQECSLWLFWLLSVTIGALAFSVFLFVLVSNQHALYEVTHNSYLLFWADVLPYLWVVMFGLMAYVAVYNVRHTKRGYRYPLWLVLWSSVVMSVLLGSALHVYKMGYYADDMLGRHMPLYSSQAQLEREMWQVPAEGRLLGKQVYSTLQPTSTIIFEDISGERWRIELNELPDKEIELIASARTVRLVGQSTAEELHIFHACGAFPWMFESEAVLEERSASRQAFVERVNRYTEEVNQPVEQKNSIVHSATTTEQRGVCADMPGVKRITKAEN